VGAGRLSGQRFLLVAAVLLLAATPFAAHAQEEAALIDLTRHPVGFLMLAIFFLAYGLVAVEDVIHLRKSKPVMLAAGLIWVLLGVVYATSGHGDALEDAARHILLDYGELMLFVIVAVTYINAMEERRLFHLLRVRVGGWQLSYRQLFWLVGGLAFVFGPVIDNLTTALVMGAVVMAIGAGNAAFIALACVNIVVAANAGGVFSPFGDITSLMVWQKGKLQFLEFFNLFLPALINFIIPATIMSFAVPAGAPQASNENAGVKPGAFGVIWLFAASIATAIAFRNFLHLPPALGMMLGLSYLLIYSYLLQRLGHRRNDIDMPLDSLKEMERVEWDTLLFFFGIIFAVGGLGVAGHLALVSDFLYEGAGPTAANITIGILGAAFDNIPLMFAVLTMDPDMSSGQWMLVTLSTGVGGSLVSIGTAAGVALMGLTRGHYTFIGHLRWTWAIALGYVGAISTHLWVNAGLL